MIISILLIMAFACISSYKRNQSITLLIFFLAWMLFAFNYDNPDYENYVYRFDRISVTWVGIVNQGISDIGFGLIMHWFNIMGVQDYYHFKFIISAISLACLFYFSAKCVKYCAYWAFLYLTFYAILDITQFRNFVGFSIVLALFPLLEKDTLRSNISFLIGVFFASTIHFSMAFFLIMGLRLIKKERKRLHLIIVSLIAILMLRDSVFGLLQDTTYYNKVDAYSRTSLLGALVTSILFVGNYFLMHYFHLHSKKIATTKEVVVHAVQKELSLANNIALYMLILIPFVFINSMPVRILRFASLIEIGYLLNYAFLVDKRTRQKIIAICFIIAVFFYFWTTNSAVDGLKHNYVIDYLL